MRGTGTEELSVYYNGRKLQRHIIYTYHFLPRFGYLKYDALEKLSGLQPYKLKVFPIGSASGGKSILPLEQHNMLSFSSLWKFKIVYNKSLNQWQHRDAFCNHIHHYHNIESHFFEIDRRKHSSSRRRASRSSYVSEAFKVTDFLTRSVLDTYVRCFKPLEFHNNSSNFLFLFIIICFVLIIFRFIRMLKATLNWAKIVWFSYHKYLKTEFLGMVFNR